MEFIKFFSLQREKSLDFYVSYSALYAEFFQDLDLLLKQHIGNRNGGCALLIDDVRGRAFAAKMR